MERYLSVDDEVCSITSARVDLSAAMRAELPAALMPAVRLLANHVPLHGNLGQVVDDGAARELWDRFCLAARRVSDPSIPDWREPEDLSDWHLVLLLARTIADGLRYPELLAAQGAAAPTVADAAAGQLAQYPGQRADQQSSRRQTRC